MKKMSTRRPLALLLAVIMLVTLLPYSAAAASEIYILDTTDDLEAFAANSKADGETQSAGTDEYFTIFYSTSTRVDQSSKNFEDGYIASQRLNFGGSTVVGDNSKNAIMIKTSGAAKVKIWWVCGGDGRQQAIYSSTGNILSQTSIDSVKNSLYISELSIEGAGTYFVGNTGGGNNYYFKIQVTESGDGAAEVERAAWSSVAAPVITAATDNGSGKLKVTVSAVVGNDGGDEIVVTMYDAKGKEIAVKRSVGEKSTHTLEFEPEDSGTYTFKAVLNRDGESGKSSASSLSADFVYPLGTPIITSATSKGSGKVEIAWTAVHEAVEYEVYCGGSKVGTTSKTQYTVTGLTVGKKYSFKVVAVRGSDRTTSDELSATATADEQVTWGFTYYGSSTNAANNGYVGDLNADGSVTVYSEGGKGKVVPASTDGLAFYYTAVPTKYNFTLRATVTVDSWTLSNGQEGFGLLVTDRLGTSGDTSAFWNNQFMALASKIEYRYDSDTETVYNVKESLGTKYTMKMGLGVIAKTGVTLKNLSKLEAGDTDTINSEFSSVTNTLEWAAGDWMKQSGTYNIIGNSTSSVEGTLTDERAVITSFILEIQKNNTGYFITYYAEDGTVLCQQKYYGADALSQLDDDYVYAGFFAARNARATFSDVEFTTILASEDAPAEEKPVTKVDPTVSISSASVSTSQEYNLFIDANVSGTVKITMGSQTLVDGEYVTANVRYRKLIELEDYGANRIKVQFMPDPNQNLGEDTVLSSTSNVYSEITVTWNKGNYHRNTIYVSPEGLPNGNGTKEYPYDIYTAVDNVVPGQTIVLMEGTYYLDTTLKIQRGMDGTEENPIRMIADPDAATRPVLDFKGLSAGIVHGGNYWYFYGFDVTNSAAGQKGFQVSGSFNTLDQINAYHNGNTGIQISRYSGTDLFEDWPAYNLILNCTSYGNADPGYEDADGFAAKLTVGEGNVFDGCVAYNNADDGWDLYAKVETGCIGSVTIRNCVAYANGILEDGTNAGNGNGFKMGGESLSGKHVLENSYAFFNKAKGIDSNSCPDIIVKNCVSYNNGSYNVAFYTNNAVNTDFSATGIISFKDSTISFESSLTLADNLKGKGTQDSSKYLGKTNYYWYGSNSTNSTGKAVTASMFVSLEFKGVARKADGTIDMQGFLELNSSAPSGTGATEGGTASSDVTLKPEDAVHNYSQTWTNTDAEYHWKECDCGDKAEMGAHDLIWVVDKEATPTETGLKHRECSVCGYKKAAITTYYEEEQQSTDPTQETTDPTAPNSGGDDSDVDTPDGGSNVVLIVVIVVVVLAAAAFVVIKFVLPKMKKESGE